MQAQLPLRQIVEVGEVLVAAGRRLLVFRSSSEMTGTGTPSISNTDARLRHASYSTPSIDVMISMRNGGVPNRTMLCGSTNSRGSSAGKEKPNERSACTMRSALSGVARTHRSRSTVALG